ncbi:hypothetical protein Pfo_031658, partial [Paulownia fortunei]
DVVGSVSVHGALCFVDAELAALRRLVHRARRQRLLPEAAREAARRTRGDSRRHRRVPEAIAAHFPPA